MVVDDHKTHAQRLRNKGFAFVHAWMQIASLNLQTPKLPMKILPSSAVASRRTLSCLTALAFFAMATSFAMAQVVYDFNTAGQLSDNFGYNVPSTPANHTNVGPQSLAGGLTNSGWVPNGVTAPRWGFEVADQAFGGATNFTLSIYFQWQTRTDSTSTTYQSLLLGVGRSSDTNAFSPVGGNAGALGPASGQLLQIGIGGIANAPDTVRIIAASVVDGTNANINRSGSATLTNGNWYFLQVDFSLLGSTNGYNAAAKLYDSSSAGVVGGLLLSDNSGNITNVNLLGGDIQAYFGMRAPTYAGITGVDNFYVSTIPEPSTIALLLAGALCALVFRKKLRV